MKTYYTYILANKKNGTIYIGVTSNLARRIYEHKNHLVDGFTKKYSVVNLVHFEQTTDVYSALEREKQLKNWRRAWKVALIENGNPDWRDLYGEIMDTKPTLSHPELDSGSMDSGSSPE